jgi:FKBP-type peptidyl-prolyl cis-trans isomerase SlyD
MSENNKKETIADGQFVGYTYRLYDDATGELLFEAPEKAPDVMVYGVNTEVIPGLLAVMKGLSEGDKFEVTLPAEAAFGEKSDDNIITLSKDIFMQDGEMPEEVKVGAELPMMTQQGFVVRGLVKEITPTDVVMDFNHPFAGRTVRYEGEIREVRPATEDEKNPRRGCGCGCGSDGECGDSCSSGGCNGCH